MKKEKQKKNSQDAQNKTKATNQTSAQKDGFRYDYDDASDVK